MSNLYIIFIMVYRCDDHYFEMNVDEVRYVWVAVFRKALFFQVVWTSIFWLFILKYVNGSSG